MPYRQSSEGGKWTEEVKILIYLDMHDLCLDADVNLKLRDAHEQRVDKMAQPRRKTLADIGTADQSVF